MTLKESGIIWQVKVELVSTFSIIDMGPISFYFILKIEQDCKKKNIKLSQPTYIDKVFIRFHLDKAYFINTQIKVSILLQQKTDKKIFTSEKK